MAELREVVYVERGGRPQVVVLAIPEYERLLAAGQSGDWLERARAARERIKDETGDRNQPAVEDLVRQVRDERGEQLDRLR